MSAKKKASERQDRQDMLNIARECLDFVRCSCGRMKLRGYVCRWCRNEDAGTWDGSPDA